MMSGRVVVFGASGFVGRAVVDALGARGMQPIPVSTPRLSPVSAEGAREASLRAAREHGQLAALLRGAKAVINAAGLSDATSADAGALVAANAAVPGLVAQLCVQSGVLRLVHVSSAAAQGGRAVLDDGPAEGAFSPYSRSKALGEELVRDLGPRDVVIYRPPGVHAAARTVSRALVRVAASPWSAVASPGSDPTPQSLLPNVADAIAYLATCDATPPGVVSHPWEGMTTEGLMERLGGRRPSHVPRRLARLLILIAKAAGRFVPTAAAHGRRLEVLWFGQGQAQSWLTCHGWTPHVGPDAWAELGNECRRLAYHSVER